MCFRPPQAKDQQAICPKCKKLNPSGEKVCAFCGAEIVEMTDDTLVGKPQSPSVNTPPKAPPVPPPKPPKVPPKPGSGQ